MKKMIILFLVLSILSIRKVSAQTYKLTLEKQPGIYYVRKGDKTPYKSSQFSIYKLGSDIAYCIEPSVNITTFNYQDNGSEISLLYSSDIKDMITLIGYYGREYPNHDNVKYSMATQALIWELTGTGEVSFWTELDGKGEEISVAKEREEILNLVNNHSKLPNISNIILNYNEELIIEDDLLNDFYVSETNDLETSIENNKLKIKSSELGDSEITLSRKRYDDKDTIIFVGGDKNNSQTLARLRYQEDINLKISVHTRGIKIKIIKKDEEGNNILIPNIKFKIKNLNTNKYVCDNDDCFFLTNNNGEIITNELDFSKYEIEEIEDQIVNGYIWNNLKYTIDISKDVEYFYSDIGCFYIVDFMNKRVKGEVEVNKMGEELEIINNEVDYKKINLDNIEFLLYDEENNYINKYITKNGYFKIDNLSLGRYYLIENNVLSNYLYDDNKYYFEIKQVNQYDEIINVKLVINNYLKKGTLEFTKKDLITNIGIPDTIIEIYNNEDILLLTKKTDNNGKVIINELPIGNYYIMEKEANELYKLTNERVYFEIDKELVQAEMVNEKKEIIVPKTKRNDNYIILMICSFLLLLGISESIYEKIY